MAYRAKRREEGRLARLFQKVIKEKDLIDTGLLYRSVDVNVQVTNAGLMLVDVSSQDYLKYLYERFFLIEDFSSKPEFKQIVNEIFQDYIAKKIKGKGFTDVEKTLSKLNTRVKVQIVN